MLLLDSSKNVLIGIGKMIAVGATIRKGAHWTCYMNAKVWKSVVQCINNVRRRVSSMRVQHYVFWVFYSGRMTNPHSMLIGEVG